MGTLKAQAPAESCARSLNVSSVAPTSTPPQNTLSVLNCVRDCVSRKRRQRKRREREGGREEGGTKTDFKISVHTVHSWRLQS